MSRDEAPARIAAKDLLRAKAETKVNALVVMARGHRGHQQHADDTCVLGCLGGPALRMLLDVGCHERLLLLTIALQQLSEHDLELSGWGVRWPGAERQVYVCTSEISAIASASLGRPQQVDDATPGAVVRFSPADGAWHEVNYAEPEKRGPRA